MGLFKKTDPLTIDAIPGGGRRVNNVPLIIGGGLVVTFLLVMGYVAMQRMNQNSVSADKAKREAHGSSQFAAEVTGGHLSGLIPPDELAKMQDPQPPASQTQLAPSKGADILALPDIPLPLPDGIDPAERERARMARLQAFEAGLRSPTTVRAAEIRRNAQGTQQNSTHATASERDDARQRLAAVRQQIAMNGTDPTAAYQARLAQVRGENPLPEARQQSDELNTFDRDNKWSLGNQLEAPASPFQLRAGFIIPATMISGINSNLPGQVMAQVSQHVYDTATGKHLLIPQGTRLVGTYNNDVAYGQERVLMAWQRMVFPDGKALDIQAMPGADGGGYGGFSDQVNNHYWRTFSSAFLLSGVIAAVAMSQDTASSRSSDRQRASDSMSEALGQTLGTAMAQMLSKNLNIAPTLEIRPGYRFNVMVTKDMTFPGPYTAFDY